MLFFFVVFHMLKVVCMLFVLMENYTTVILDCSCKIIICQSSCTFQMFPLISSNSVHFYSKLNSGTIVEPSPYLIFEADFNILK